MYTSPSAWEVADAVADEIAAEARAELAARFDRFGSDLRATFRLASDVPVELGDRNLSAGFGIVSREVRFGGRLFYGTSDVFGLRLSPLGWRVPACRYCSIETAGQLAHALRVEPEVPVVAMLEVASVETRDSYRTRSGRCIAAGLAGLALLGLAALGAISALSAPAPNGAFVWAPAAAGWLLVAGGLAGWWRARRRVAAQHASGTRVAHGVDGMSVGA